MLGFIIARALAACVGIRIVALVQMSNHIHIVLQDQHCELVDFMNRVAGQIGAEINVLDGISGPLFGRRYDAERILDREALMDRIAYTIMNPVKAGLVERPEDWPGLLMWVGGATSATFERDVMRRQKVVGKVSFDLEMATECVSAEEIEGVRREVEARCVQCAQEREGRPVLGAAAAKRQDPFSRPKNPKRSRKPLCHASTIERWRQFKAEWRAFVDAYRRASAAFRSGNWTVPFPDGCFRPWVPVGVVGV